MRKQVDFPASINSDAWRDLHGAISMRDMNCLKFGYLPWRYPRNWGKNFVQFFRSIKMAYQRATKGYCYYDLFSMDSWHSNLMCNAMLEFKDACNGYPGVFLDETECKKGEPEKGFTMWQSIIEEIAINFWLSDEWNDAFKNPYSEAMSAIYESQGKRATVERKAGCVSYHVEPTPAEEETALKWRDCEIDNYAKRAACKNKAMDLMKEWYYHLWD